MTNEQFDVLLKRRDELSRRHEIACAILYEGECNKQMQYRQCVQLHDELAALQQKIDDELADEQGREG